MKTRQLGTTGMNITPVGLGAFALGNDWPGAWGTQDRDRSIAAIRHGIDRGLNWVDTAPAYGLGQADEVIRDALTAFSEADRPYVFTKCGLVWDPDNRQGPLQRLGDPGSLRSGVEDSLRRLGVERLDLLQMHWPPNDGTPIEEYWGTLVEMKSEGTVAAIGLSNHSVDLLERAEAVGHVDTLQPPFSAINRDAAEAALPWCAEHEVGVIVYSPMQSGLLTGRFTEERAAQLPPNDWRSRDAQFTPPRLSANLELVDAMRPIADRYGTSVASVAIAWTLAWPQVTGAIVGARTPEQLDGWFDVTELTLDEADLRAIAEAIKLTEAGFGPATPSSLVEREA
jgi:aryl-alcohol dehydrogenase-like predicted oxidoreductase